MGNIRGGKQPFHFPYTLFNVRFGSRPLAPVPVRSSTYDQRRPPSAYQSSLWDRFNAYIRYYATQWRWDIERTIARLLHRRWI
jgi:hypothetical protein